MTDTRSDTFEDVRRQLQTHEAHTTQDSVFDVLPPALVVELSSRRAARRSSIAAGALACFVLLASGAIAIFGVRIGSGMSSSEPTDLRADPSPVDLAALSTEEIAQLAKRPASVVSFESTQSETAGQEPRPAIEAAGFGGRGIFVDPADPRGSF